MSFPVLALLALAPRALPDRLVTIDGRVLEVVDAKEDGDHWRIVLPAGEIRCPKSSVASVEAEGDMSDYVPADDREREYLAQGYVRYRGRWMSKSGYEDELRKVADERRKRTAELAAHSDFANAWTLETKHFVVKSNTSPEILQHYADLLEAYYALMDDRIGIKPTPTMKRTKMTVNIYKSHAELLKLSDSEIDESVLGYFWSVDNTLNFFHDYKDPAMSEMVGLHECTHLLTYLIDQDYLPQVWINEAVADYYGCATIERDTRGRVAVQPGRVQLDQVLTVQQAIAAGKYTRLTELFLITDEEFDGFHYAHAWSFVYFLLSKPEYARTFERWFEQLYTQKLAGYKTEKLDAGWDDKTGQRLRYKPEDVRDALLKALKKKSLDDLEREWLEFVGAMPIEGPRARFQRAYETVKSGEGDLHQAKEDILYAISQGLADPRAHWTLGYLQIADGAWDEAAKSFRRAIELAPLEALYRAELGWALSGWWGEGTPEGTPDELSEAQQCFDLAKELAPDEEQYGELAAGYRAARGG